MLQGSPHFLQLTSTLFFIQLPVGACFLPPSASKFLGQFSLRCTQNAAEDLFPQLGIPSLNQYFLLLLFSCLLLHGRWPLARHSMTALPVCALQRCRSCRWQLTSPGSRWRRSSVWTSTGASASPGAPLEPRKARRRTSELPVSKLDAISSILTVFPNKLPAYCPWSYRQDDYFLSWWLCRP